MDLWETFIQTIAEPFTSNYHQVVCHESQIMEVDETMELKDTEEE